MDLLAVLLIKVKIDYSKKHYVGLFAQEFIPEGKIVCLFEERPALSWRPLEAIKKCLSERDRRSLSELWFSDHDNFRLMNHEDEPNLITTGLTDVALRDIEDGEELTINYEKFYKVF